ncbi:hypothetical protein T492DRAFT_347393 [Pavlovales sp. CCMP2436]|nr:hypothetical protein T492DRAFT_347393 [Pavlovales sp. CCMP2436]
MSKHPRGDENDAASASPAVRAAEPSRRRRLFWDLEGVVEAGVGSLDHSFELVADGAHSWSKTKSMELARREGPIRLAAAAALLAKDLSLSDEPVHDLLKLDLSYSGSLPELSTFVNLQILCADGTELECIPDSLYELRQLRVLSLAHNRLKEVGRAISQLSLLKHLLLDENPGLTSLPKLPQLLSKLSLIDCTISLLPASLSLLTLEEISLEGNCLEKNSLSLALLTAHFSETKTVPLERQWLNAGRCQLATLPVSIGNATRLTHLSLHSNQLCLLPPELALLGQLRKLDLSYNRLSGPLPSVIFAITKLTSLDATGNQLVSVSREIKKLSSLRYLWLADNRLAELAVGAILELPDLCLLGLATETAGEDSNLALGDALIDASRSVKSLRAWLDNLQRAGEDPALPPELRTVLPQDLTGVRDIVCSGLDHLPELIGKLATLRRLELSELGAGAELPSSYASLRLLGKVTLRGKELDSKARHLGPLCRGLPADASGQLNWTELMYLTVNFSALASVPEAVCKMVCLVEINLDHNRLKKLPPALGRLCALVSLSVEDNLLEELTLDDCSGGLENLQVLNVVGNHIASTPSLGCLPSLKTLQFKPQARPQPGLAEAMESLAEAMESLPYDEGRALREYARAHDVADDEDEDEGEMTAEEERRRRRRLDHQITQPPVVDLTLSSEAEEEEAEVEVQQKEDPLRPSIDQILARPVVITSRLGGEHKPHDKQQEVGARIFGLIKETLEHPPFLALRSRFDDFELVVAVPELNSLYDQTKDRLLGFAEYYATTREQHFYSPAGELPDGACFKIASGGTGGGPFSSVKGRIEVHPYLRLQHPTCNAMSPVSRHTPQPSPVSRPRPSPALALLLAQALLLILLLALACST